LRPGQQKLVDELLPRLEIDSGAETLDPRALFDPPKGELWLEIGFGGGEHLAWQAARRPDVGFIGAEIFINGVATLLREVEDKRLENIRIWREDGRALLDALPPACLSRVFILHPDPWPKARHHKRRIVQAAVLDRLAEVMIPGGELRLATDDPSYQSWMVERLSRHPAFEWLARRPADWREPPEDWPRTRYEAKAVAEGRTPLYLRYRRKA
jgi:tRNA (guanine-N7-)-methyltransferase